MKKPVFLKRGMSTNLEELLMSAEYILSQGNPDVILCERGIRTFETATRNTLDLTAVPLLKELTHLPVVVDPEPRDRDVAARPSDGQGGRGGRYRRTHDRGAPQALGSLLGRGPIAQAQSVRPADARPPSLRERGGPIALTDRSKMPVLFVFVDGLGIGRPAPTIPSRPWRRGRSRSRGRSPAAGALPAPRRRRLPGGARPAPERHRGAALFTGENAPSLVGRHLPGMPNGALRKLIARRGLLRRARERGAGAEFANAYTPGYFGKGRVRRRSVTTVMAECAGHPPEDPGRSPPRRSRLS